MLQLFLAIKGICLSGAVGWFFFDRHRLKRRAAPGSELLIFPSASSFDWPSNWLSMMSCFASWRDSKINRPREQTPMEFGRSLLFLPENARMRRSSA